MLFNNAWNFALDLYQNILVYFSVEKLYLAENAK